MIPQTLLMLPVLSLGLVNASAALAQTDPAAASSAQASAAVVTPAPEPRNESRYKVFIQRNPFGLKDPPPPPVTKGVVPTPPPSKTFLTGISLNPRTSPPSRAAQFKRQDANNKFTEFSLKEGQAKDGLEVLAIEPDLISTKVRVMEDGVPVVYTFALNGVPVARGNPAGAPGQPGALPGARVGVPAMPMINGSPAGIPTAATAPTRPAMPAPNPSVRGTLNVTIPQPSAAVQYSTVSGALPSKSVSVPTPAPNAPVGISIPTVSAPGVSVISTGNPEPQRVDSGMSSQQQQFIMELNRVVNPGLPPTPGIPAPGLPGVPAQ